MGALLNAMFTYSDGDDVRGGGWEKDEGAGRVGRGLVREACEGPLVSHKCRLLFRFWL